MFNAELVKWKDNRYEIRNLIVTYHLYENLFSRLKVTFYLSFSIFQVFVEEKTRQTMLFPKPLIGFFSKSPSYDA